jgi:hypothetical protein
MRQTCSLRNLHEHKHLDANFHNAPYALSTFNDTLEIELNETQLKWTEKN